jgi:hypothetical protein
MPISRIEPNVVSVGNDAVYGSGVDGNITISGTVTLTSDKYYNNLIVPLGNVLLTNGFRVFVKGTATINGVVGVGTVTGNVNNSTNGTTTSSSSSVSSGTAAGHTSGSITYRIGGQGGGATNPNVSILPSYLVKRVEALTGLVIDATVAASPVALSGGSKGTTGSTGTTTTALTNGSSWAGKAGGAGSNGAYGPNASTVNAPGGKGNTGNVGTATGATNGTGGAGGAGGNGGPVVVLVAKHITGTGTLISLGMSGSAGSAGNTGSPGTAGAGPTAYTSTTQRGTSGVDLNDGHQAPAIQHTNHHTTSHTTHHHYAYQTHHHYLTPDQKGGHFHTCCIDSHASHTCCAQGHASGHAQGADSHYAGGAGGAGGAAAPAVTGGAGKRGGAGGGGAIIIVTESTPSSLSYDNRSGTTADSDTFSGSSGSVYTILNT